MFISTRIATAVTVAVLSVLPGISAAQTDTTARERMTTPQQGSGASDSAEARARLSQARQTLAELTKLPAAAQLTGEPRAQLENVITHFNRMITSKTDWTTEFMEVRDSLNRLLGPADGTNPDRPVGTAGRAGVNLDPAIAAKLEELRSHLAAFYTASGNPPLDSGDRHVPEAPPPSSAPEASNPVPSNTPSPAPVTEAPPAKSAATEPSPSSTPPVGTVSSGSAITETTPPPDLSRPGTSSVTVGSTTVTSDAPAEQSPRSTPPSTPEPGAVGTSGTGSLAAHLADMAAIVDEALAIGSGGSVVMDRAKLEAIKMHIEQLRTLLPQGR